MRAMLAKWSLVLFCASMGAAIGGGLYEHIVLMPIWSASPPSSFTIIQPETGVPLQRFWIPVHAAITVFGLLAVITAWRDVNARRLLLIGLASDVVMRVWSGVFFIPEFIRKPPPGPSVRHRAATWSASSTFTNLASAIVTEKDDRRDEGPIVGLCG